MVPFECFVLINFTTLTSLVYSFALKKDLSFDFCSKEVDFFFLFIIIINLFKENAFLIYQK